MIAYCAVCGDKIDADKPGTYQWMSGWGKRRAKGGVNAIRLPHRQMRFACGACVDALAHGYGDRTNDLFGGDVFGDARAGLDETRP